MILECAGTNAVLRVLTPGLFQIRLRKGRSTAGNNGLPLVGSLPEPSDDDQIQIEESKDRWQIKTKRASVVLKKNGLPSKIGTLSISIPNVNEVSDDLTAPDDANLGGVICKTDGCDAVQVSRSRYLLFRDDKHGKALEQINIPPGLLSRRGWTALSHVGEEFVNGVHGDIIYLFVYGQDYPSALTDFVRLCGAPPMIPAWALGNWFSRFYQYCAKDYEQIVDRFRKEKMPLDVIMLDTSWHKKNWNDMEYNLKNFPDMRKFLRDMHARGIIVGFNHHPGKAIAHSLHDQETVGVILRSDPRVEQFLKVVGYDTDAKIRGKFKVGPSLRPEDCLLYDLREQKELDAYQQVFIHPCHKDGMDFNWIDSCGWYKLLETNFRESEKFSGKRTLILGRTTQGSYNHHRVPASFAGDIYRTWAMLAKQIEITARCGNNALAYWSHDIGGYKSGEPTAEMYVRWMQFGALSPIFRPHACTPTNPNSPPEGYAVVTNEENTRRTPWDWGDEVLSIARNAYQLRQSLHPYLYTLSRQTHDTGVPLCRGMYLHYPEYDEAYVFPQQYLLGESLLVAPVVHPALHGPDGEAIKEIWFPPGTWIDWFSGESVEGPCVMKLGFALDRIPLYVKAGAVVPMHGYREYVMEPVQPELRLRLFPIKGVSSGFTLYEDDGFSFEHEKQKHRITRIVLSHGNGITLEIGPSRGRFKGMPKNRDLLIDLPFVNSLKVSDVSGNKPERVKQVQGAAFRVKDWSGTEKIVLRFN